MKNIAKSLAQNVFPINFTVSLDIEGDKLVFKTRKDKNTISSRTFDFSEKPLGSKELSARDNIYILADENGIIQPFYNKMAESYATKDSGYKHILKQGKHTIGQIYIPFADATIDECSVRITYGEEFGYKSNVEITEEVTDFGKFFDDVSPTLKATKESNGAIKVQVTDSLGSPIKKAGVKLYAKTDGGQLVFNEKTTNSEGNASFKLLTAGFEASDEATVEFGFKWSSNLARVKVAAQ
jgi:hypothetical protein